MARTQEQKNAQNRERYAWLKEHGFCITCGCNYAEPGRIRCKACRDRQMEKREEKRYYSPQYFNNMRQQRIKKGLCVACGKPAIPGKRMCEHCRKKCNDRARIYKIKQKIEREVQRARARTAGGGKVD